jgi:hypothetical protein
VSQQQQLHQLNAAAARKYGFNLSQIGKVVAAIQQHPEVLQIVSLAAQLRGNPGLIGQVQDRATRALLACLVAADGVAEYVAAAERAAGVQSSPLFASAHQALDGLLAQFGPQAPGGGATDGISGMPPPAGPTGPGNTAESDS